MNTILAAIILTGLSANDPVPGTYLEINFAQGDSAGSGSDSEVLLIGNKTTGGAATVETIVYGPDSQVPLQTYNDAVQLFGQGSELHRMFMRFTALNKSTTLRAIVVAESTGAAATAVTTITNAATSNATMRIYMYEGFVDVPITSGDAANTVGANAVTYFNNEGDWGAVASFNSGTGVLTFTSKQKGLRGNQLRIQIALLSNGAAVGTALSALTADTFFTGGTTSDSNANALATIANAHYYYLTSAAGDATQLGALVTQIGQLATPIIGNRQRAIAASTDTLANATTIATGRNSARCEIVWSEKNPWPEAELAADHAAKITIFETKPNPRTNWCNFGQTDDDAPFQVVPAQRVHSVWPSRTSIASALNNGLSPIGVNPNGSTYLVNGITTRSLNGSINDYRIRARHKVTICDFFGDDLLIKTTLQFSGKRIGNDPVQGQRPPGPEVVTPILWRGAINTLIDVYDGNNLLQNVPDTKANTKVQREKTPPTRMSCRIPLAPIDNAEQFAIALDQVA